MWCGAFVGGEAVKVAVISDIHANAVALDAVLADMEGDRVDRLICLGDLPALNPQPREVMERIYALGCPVLRGNVDDRIPRHLSAEPESAVAFRSVVGPLPPDEVAQRLHDIEVWCADQLTDADNAWLLALPLTLEIPLDDRTTLLCFHGSPRSNMDLLFPAAPDAALDEFLAGVAAPVMVGGHTHAQMLRPYRDKTLINVGSVGRAVIRAPMRRIRNAPWAEYGIIGWESGRLSVDLRRVPFDLEQLVTAMYTSGMPHAAWWEAEWRR
jgi:predicted phosphodiesterase